jgi:hypothetical protein
MLPLLNLDFQALCPTALNLGHVDGSYVDSLTDAEIEKACRAYTGQSFAYREEQLREKAIRSGQNLDQILSHELLYGFTRNPIRRKSLLWLGRRFGCVLITLCDSRGQLNPSWMSSITGYIESAGDYVGETDRPYAYWDSHNFHRIYPDVTVESATGLLVCDFGNAFGWSVGEAESEGISEILAAYPDAWEYSIVAANREEIVSVHGARCLLLHSHYRQVGASP